ncbi:hypothetical protein [Sphingomonas sp. ID0503]|uniref:hypothetical protein n=1 Tax=Sphingomonas sp. ID0503 TaxID=3399691 RepID=UPI003AFB7E1E
MSTDKIDPQDIEKAAGKEDESGVIQPSVSEILDSDPENATDEDAQGLAPSTQAPAEGSDDVAPPSKDSPQG